MRAFVAIDLPAAIRKKLEEEQAVLRTLCPDASHEGRWVRPEGIHLTLKFLGQISPDQLDGVNQALHALAPVEPFSIEVKGLGAFPDLRRPRVLWVGVEGPPELAELAHRVEEALEKLGFPAEQRPFTPHLTLARFKTPKAQPKLAGLAQRDLSLGRFEVTEFFLFESKLSPRGAEYRRVEPFSRD